MAIPVSLNVKDYTLHLLTVIAHIFTSDQLQVYDYLKDKLSETIKNVDNFFYIKNGSDNEISASHTVFVTEAGHLRSKIVPPKINLHERGRVREEEEEEDGGEQDFQQ